MSGKKLVFVVGLGSGVLTKKGENLFSWWSRVSGVIPTIVLCLLPSCRLVSPPAPSVSSG